MSRWFSLIAQWTGEMIGRPVAFMLACLACAVWAATGPMFHYSDTWQLVINTGTTVLTFLMLFLLQNTQIRDMRILQIKLNELIAANENARNTVLAVSDEADDQIAVVEREYIQKGRSELP
jgi:low affinity Fe/Cu permease